MSKLLLTATALGLILATPAMAEDSALLERIAKLEKELAELKEATKASNKAKEEAAKPSASSAVVEYKPGKGLSVTNADKTAGIRIGGFGQMDSRTFTDTSNQNKVDQFLLRTARIVVDADLNEEFSSKFTYDFGNNTTSLVDAYVDYKPAKEFNVRAGKFKAPLGLERLQSETETMTLDRNLNSNLSSSRDLGVMVYGEVVPKTLDYQIALTNGAADGASTSSDLDGGKDVVARVFAHPFHGSDYKDLEGLGVGVAGSYGQRDGVAGSNTTNYLGSGYRSHGQQTVFSYLNSSFADGTAWRVNPQGYYYNGPFGAMSEYIYTSQEITNGTSRAELNNDAWYVAASYLLTGEKNGYKGITPENEFNFAENTWGAWEVMARYGVLDIDNDTFPTFATASSAVSKAVERTIGLNWHLNSNLKLNTAYSDTEFEGGATTGDLENERVYLTRLQFKI
jgi:phosphate-selective porin OprO/OprP